MNELLVNLTVFQQIFFVIAASSTIILIIQTVLSVIGLAGNSDIESVENGLGDVGDSADISGGADSGDGIEIEIGDTVADAADIAGADSADAGDTASVHRDAGSVYDNGLRLFTIKGIMAFLMVGSWVGFLISRAGIHEVIALIFALITGTAGLYFMAKLMRMLLSLQEDGTTNVKNALGQTGQVYIRIPGEEKGVGKVNVTVQSQLREFDAVTEKSETIKTGETVYITDIRAGNVLVVEKVEKAENPE